MDVLMGEIQDFLTPKLAWVSRHDVRLIPHPGVIPEEVGFPYVGIKDGDVANHERPGNTLDQVMVVEVYIYDELDYSGESIPGLHQKARKIRELLRGNRLDGAVSSVEPVAEMAVALLFTDDGMVIRKGLRFKYERHG